MKIKTGALEEKYQPYAKTLELCVVMKVAGPKYYKHIFSGLTNTAKAGTNWGKLYMKSAGWTGGTSTVQEC